MCIVQLFEHLLLREASIQIKKALKVFCKAVFKFSNPIRTTTNVHYEHHEYAHYSSIHLHFEASHCCVHITKVHNHPFSCLAKRARTAGTPYFKRCPTLLKSPFLKSTPRTAHQIWANIGLMVFGCLMAFHPQCWQSRSSLSWK